MGKFPQISPSLNNILRTGYIPYQINWQYTDQVKCFPLLYIIHIVGHDYHYEISIKSQTRLFDCSQNL